jgi:hypothetical protein
MDPSKFASVLPDDPESLPVYTIVRRFVRGKFPSAAGVSLVIVMVHATTLNG